MSKFEKNLGRASSARNQARNLLVNPGAVKPPEGEQAQDPPPHEPSPQDPKPETKTDPPKQDPPKADPNPQEQEQPSATKTKPRKAKEQGEREYAYRPKIHKRERQQETHTSQAYMIENELIGIINDIVGDAWGGKYRFVNEAIKLMIYQEFPEYADRIRIRE